MKSHLSLENGCKVGDEGGEVESSVPVAADEPFGGRGNGLGEGLVELEAPSAPKEGRHSWLVC